MIDKDKLIELVKEALFDTKKEGPVTYLTGEGGAKIAREGGLYVKKQGRFYIVSSHPIEEDNDKS